MRLPGRRVPDANRVRHRGMNSDIRSPYRYNGGKGSSGVVQTIINQIPPHQTYIEAFVGGGAVFRAKAPAASSILIDRDPAVVDEWKRRCEFTSVPVTILQADALERLPCLVLANPECFVYLDPPYVHATRRDINLYRYEMDDDAHRRLLHLLETLSCPWALSGYRSAMYDEAARLNGWRRVDYRRMGRRGPVVESLWVNYPAPSTIAETTFAGSGFRERERIKRKVMRWAAKFEALSAIEQQAIFSRLASICTNGGAGLP